MCDEKVSLWVDEPAGRKEKSVQQEGWTGQMMVQNDAIGRITDNGSHC